MNYQELFRQLVIAAVASGLGAEECVEKAQRILQIMKRNNLL